MEASRITLFLYTLGGKGYDPEKADYSDFEAWLQCYYVDGMKSIRDHNGRTMWFTVSPRKPYTYHGTQWCLFLHEYELNHQDSLLP